MLFRFLLFGDLEFTGIIPLYPTVFICFDPPISLFHSCLMLLGTDSAVL